MKIYNALSKSFTDEVKMSIFGWDLSPTPTPEPTPLQTTPPPIDVNELTRGDGEENGFYYVDLGLSVKWATCNVGASLASDDGLLFQFGRVDGYRYKDTNHQFRTNGQDKEVTGSEYIPLTASGTKYDKGATLGSDDDAAYVNMEGNWRMPKESEFSELLENTTHDVVTVNGVNGMLFTSKKNGHKLFIPFMKVYWNGTRFSAIGHIAYMWASQVYSFNAYYAYNLYCHYGNYASSNSSYRTHAFSVRGVFKK